MENKQTEYCWFECEKEDCREKFPVPVPDGWFSQSPDEVEIACDANCPSCGRLNILRYTEGKAATKKEIKSWRLQQKYKMIKCTFTFWEKSDPN